MAWDINQINNAFMAQVLGNSPAQSFDRGRLMAKEEQIFDENRAAALAAAQRQAAREQAKEQARAQLATDPSIDNHRRYLTLFPEDREAIKTLWDQQSAQNQKAALSSFHNLRGYLSMGETERGAKLAADHLRQRIEAERAAGLDVADDEALLDQIVNNPRGALGVITNIIASVSDPTKTPEGMKAIGENDREQAKLPAEIQKLEGEAAEAQAKGAMAPRIIESDLANEESERTFRRAQISQWFEENQIKWADLGLRREEMEAKVDLELGKLEQTNGKVPDSMLKPITDAVTNAQAFEGRAQQALNLANDIDASDMQGGLMASWTAGLRQKYGDDPIGALRGQFEQLKNANIVASLPPGPATDRDILIFSRGVPEPYAKKAVIVDFLRTMARMQKVAADNENIRAEWISANGHLGTAKRTMVIDGYRVDKGDSLLSFQRKMNAIRKPPVPAAAQALADRYRK